MSWPLAGLFLLSGAVGAAGELSAARAEAREAEENARAALFDRERMRIDLPRRLAQVQGAAAAMAAATGALGTNNAYEAQTQATFETVLEAERQMEDLTTQATAFQRRARNARTAGQLRAASALLGGATRGYSVLSGRGGGGAESGGTRVGGSGGSP